MRPITPATKKKLIEKIGNKMTKYAKKPDNAFDRELAASGKMRTYRVEVVQNPDGSFATIYRQVIVPIENKMPRREAVRVNKPIRQGTKLAEVVSYVNGRKNESNELLILGIMNLLEVKRSNAGVYLSKALKLV